jgi:hypothetical protein
MSSDDSIDASSAWEIVESIRTVPDHDDAAVHAAVTNGDLVVPRLCAILTQHSNDAALMLAALQALERVLHAGAVLAEPAGGEYGSNPFADEMEQVDGLDTIEQLQHHQDEGVYQAAVRLLEAHFCADE